MRPRAAPLGRRPRHRTLAATLGALLSSGPACLDSDPAGGAPRPPDFEPTGHSAASEPHSPRTEGRRDAPPAQLESAPDPTEPDSGPAEGPAPPENSGSAGDPTTGLRAWGGQGPFDAPLDTPEHYVKSNEIRHDLFFADLPKQRVHLGVGADQNYTLIAASSARAAILFDIDPRVVDLHVLYGLLLEDAEEPPDLIRAFDDEERDRVLATISARFPELRARALRASYRASRRTVAAHLRRLLARERPNWLNDPTWFRWVREAHLSGRIVAVPGNLVGPHTLKRIGAWMDEHGLRLGALYTSNAEEFFLFQGAYTSNLRSLPHDRESVVLRTLSSKRWTRADGLWSYQVQGFEGLLARLATPQGNSLKAMLRQANKEGGVRVDQDAPGLSRVDHP